MQKEKVLVICHLTDSKCNGQVAKTKDVIAFLEKHNYEVDIYNYGKISKLSVFLEAKKVIRNYENIVLMPGDKKALFFFIKLIHKLKKQNAHYVAIGGWVLNLIQNDNNKQYFEMLKSFKGVYLQNKHAVEIFEEKGFKNVFNIFSFSSKAPLTSVEAKQKAEAYKNVKEYKFCFFARVERTKGVLLACDAIKKTIEKYPNLKIYLDIFGEIKDNTLKNELNTIIKTSSFIKYKGVLEYNCTKELSQYYCMLFPTFYHGEGTPHTIIESFMAALPAIASDWAYNSEIIKDKQTGLLFKLNTDELFKKICWAIEHPEQLKNMSIACYEDSKQFNTNNLLAPLINNLKS